MANYPDVPLADTRERHAEARKLLAAGVDPMAQRKAEKAALMASDANSFHAIAGLWLAHWSVGKSARHVSPHGGAWKRTCSPRRARPIAEIEAPELVATVKAIDARDASDPCHIDSNQVLSEVQEGSELFGSIALTPNQFDAYAHDEPTDSACRDIDVSELGPLRKSTPVLIQGCDLAYILRIQ
jgi:hypothetical protein